MSRQPKDMTGFQKGKQKYCKAVCRHAPHPAPITHRPSPRTRELGAPDQCPRAQSS